MEEKTTIEDPGKNLYILIVTHNRPELLKNRSLPSIMNQTYQPSKVVIVDDSSKEEIREENRSILDSFFLRGEYIYLINDHKPGAGGAWNKGIEWIYNDDPYAWIAVIDDDDEWTDEHLETCIKKSTNGEIVISGISTHKDGEIVHEKRPDNFEVSDFYEGNPGWQGSNTFINANILEEVGGFDEDLLCCHDRDLAVRILKNIDPKISFTDKTTVNFYLESQRNSLTMSKPGKWTGLLQFFSKHKENMDKTSINKFKSRSENVFSMDSDLYELLEVDDEYLGFKNEPIVGGGTFKKGLYKLYSSLKIKLGQWRAKKYITQIFGKKYERSRSKIEIDLTYKCNLKCEGCNRSCKQAPDDLEISLEKIENFVSQSIDRNIEWEKIRLLGGEPTLHSKFEEILYILAEYKSAFPKSRLEIVTNNHGREVKRNLLKVPPFFHIETNKKKFFYPFNIAPRDLPYMDNIDYSNGCSNLETCGMALTPLGYYPCSLSGGIDRIAGWKIGLKNIPSDDNDMTDILEKTCPYCGRFTQRIFLPRDIDFNFKPEEKSDSWIALYRRNDKKSKPGDT